MSIVIYYIYENGGDLKMPATEDTEFEDESSHLAKRGRDGAPGEMGNAVIDIGEGFADCLWITQRAAKW